MHGIGRFVAWRRQLCDGAPVGDSTGYGSGDSVVYEEKKRIWDHIITVDGVSGVFRVQRGGSRKCDKRGGNSGLWRDIVHCKISASGCSLLYGMDR